MFNAPSAPSGLTDGTEYLGCTEAREKRRACHDDRCLCRDTCRLWTERDSPEYATRAMTWRAHWRCFSEPCDYWQATEEQHGIT